MKIRLCFVATLLCLPLWQAGGQSRVSDGRASAQRPYSYEPSLTCSPAPCVLPPTLASEGTSTNIYAPVAVNPANPAQLIVGSDDGNCHGFYPRLVGFHVSSDAGSTWITTCMGYLDAFGQLWEPGDLPMVSYDLKGAAYIAGYYGYCSSEGFNCYSVVGMEKSTYGEDWMGPFTALGNASSEITWASLAVDQTPSSPYANSIYVLGVNLAVSSQVLVSRSRDGGNTWSVSQVGAEPPHSSAWNYNPSITVGEDGTIYLAWMHCPGPSGDCSPNSIEDVAFSKSSDGGETWSKPTLIAQVVEVPNPSGCGCYPFGPIPNTDVYAPNTPALGVDNSSNGPFAGRLYATMFEWTGTYMRVQVIHSPDGGSTWS
jgi:hypothetical protein